MSKTRAYNIDCMEYMATLPDKAFDLAIVDPPYGINISKKTQRGHHDVVQKNGSVITVNRDGLAYRDKSWDKKPPSVEYFKELDRVSKRYIIWGCNFMSI
ncbi:MAG: hypothetical protein ACRC9P_01870, partial [Bacteroides sp.]